jgi:CheY-like chemotaxis protein
MESKKKKILIAEDEIFNFIYIEAILSDMNLELMHVFDGVQAIEMCKKESEISLVLMDIKMPLLDGHQATSEIKKIRLDLPIIAQSAYTFDQYKNIYNENVFDDYITKPIYENILKQKIVKWLNLKKKGSY